MKALSIKQPWAYAVTHLGKDVENRTWRYPLSYRGLLLIHAAKKDDDGAELVVEERAGRRIVQADVHRGGLVGMARLVDMTEDYPSPWAIPGDLHIILADAIPLPFVPMKGALGLFDVTAAQLGQHRDAYLAARETLLSKAVPT